MRRNSKKEAKKKLKRLVLGKKEKVGRASLLVWAYISWPSSEWAKCTAPPKTFF